MAEIRIYKTSEIVLIWLHRNGKTQQWLADQMGITRQSLAAKLKDNSFSVADLSTLKRLNILTD